MAAKTTARSISFEAKCLKRVFRVLHPFEGRTFEFQGEVAVTKGENSIRFAINPLEWITLEHLGDSKWKVWFTINDADDHGMSWEQHGAFGHVIHSFRGYIVNKISSLVSAKELKRLVELE